MNPYGDWASRYWEAGWRGVLPLPPGQKAEPPGGYTGAGGAWPSYADVMAWAEDRPHANLGIRLPPDVIGLDVDTYSGKDGAATLHGALMRFGDLPDTWYSTSRHDQSGIFLYRVPPGMRWPGQVGPHVEIIQTRHRYMVVPPSRHPAGRIYEWYTPLGIPPVMDSLVPHVADIPELPEAWITGLTAGLAASPFEKHDVSAGQVSAWLRDNARAHPCRIMVARMERVIGDLMTGKGSRHDIALNALGAFSHLAREGHTGATHAAREVHRAWLDMVTMPGEGSRDVQQGEAEWDRMLSGAVAMSLAYGDPGAMPDPCTVPLAARIAGVPADDTGAVKGSSDHGSGAIAPSASPLSAPPDQGSGQMLPPTWVTGETGDDAGWQPDVALPTSAMEHGDDSTDGVWDHRAAAVALEVERLEVRRDARLQLAHSDHLKTWREPPSYSLRELLALPDEPLAWRVADVMPEGSNVLLAAQYKTGKTTMMNELIRSLADGEDFLGTFKVSPGNVAVFNYEVGQAQYGRWLRDRGIANADSVYVFNLRGFTLPLSVPLIRDHVVRWLTNHGISVWIVDPFARAFSGAGDENNNADVAPFLETLDGIKEESGVAELVMPTHTGRAEFAQGAERARGATRLDDWCDVRWLLTKDDEGARYFRATGRDVETEETRLEYDPITRGLTLGSGSRPPRVARRDARGAYGAQNGAGSRSGPVEDVVLEVLADVPGASAGQIRDGVRARGVAARNAVITDAVRKLRQQGRLRVEGIRSSTGGRPLERHWVLGEVPNAGE